MHQGENYEAYGGYPCPAVLGENGKKCTVGGTFHHGARLGVEHKGYGENNFVCREGEDEGKKKDAVHT